MIKFMVDLRTSSDGAAVAGIVELREVVARLRADLDEVTGNVSGEDQAVSSETEAGGGGRLSPAVAAATATAAAADSESSENAPAMAPAPKTTARRATSKKEGA